LLLAALESTTIMSPTTKLPPQMKPLPDFDKLAFALTETDCVYRAHGDTRRSPVWDGGEFVAWNEVTVSPAAAFMSYGLGIFEGLKAQRAADGRILLFRPEKNAERFQRSAERLLMAPFPARQFVEAVEELVRRNVRFLPPHGKGTLYIRPLEQATEPKLGLGPSTEFAVTMFASPVGSYFAGAAAGKAKGPAGVRLQVLEQGRVAPGGTGAAKAMGNYAGGIATAHAWKQKGFDDVLYLDARHLRFVTETSGSNVFLQRKDGKIVTPPLDDQVLPGVTRESAIHVARTLLRLEVEERPLPIEEVLEEGAELFCTGTAWTIQSVRELVHRGRTYPFPRQETRLALLEILLGMQTGEREDTFGWTHEVAAGAP
jgi:branched-chain amino acid aminotransferase